MTRSNKHLSPGKASLILATSALALTLSTGLKAEEAPKNAIGAYKGSGCASPGKEGEKVNRCVPAGKSDRVTISQAKDGALKMKARIVFDHGHICSAEGPATWSETDKSFVLTAEGMDPQKPCRLAAHLDGKMLTLEDVGGSCRDVYCGAGGTFDGLVFKKK